MLKLEISKITFPMLIQTMRYITILAQNLWFKSLLITTRYSTDIVVHYNMVQIHISEYAFS